MTPVEQVIDRMRLTRALQTAAIALGLAAIVLGLGGGVWAISPLLLLATVRRPSATSATARLDAHLDQDGAVRTAWDHRADASPMAAAQRARIVARLTDAHVRAAAPRPHPAWALCLGLFAWSMLGNQLTSQGISSPGSGAPATIAAATTDGIATPKAPRIAPDDGPASAASKASARSTAPRSTPPTGPKSDGAGAGGATAKIAGVGAQAGDRLALPVTADRVGLSPGTAAGLWLSDASGAPLPDPPIRVALAPPGGSPDDDITDPARPYPRRYHTLIARWFAR